MPRIRCRYIDCVYLDDDYCSAASVEIDPDEGCLTYVRIGEIPEEEWEEGELGEIWDGDEVEIFLDDEEEDDWLEEEEL